MNVNNTTVIIGTMNDVLGQTFENSDYGMYTPEVVPMVIIESDGCYEQAEINLCFGDSNSYDEETNTITIDVSEPEYTQYKMYHGYTLMYAEQVHGFFKVIGPGSFWMNSAGTCYPADEDISIVLKKFN